MALCVLATLVLTAAFFAVIGVTTPGTSGALPLFGSYALALLVQSVLAISFALVTYAMIHMIFGLGRLDGTFRSSALWRRLVVMCSASLRRVVEKTGVVAVTLTVGTSFALAVFSPSSGQSGATSAFATQSAAQLGVGICAVVLIIAYEAVRVLEDLLRDWTPILRRMLTVLLSTFAAAFATEAQGMRTGVMVSNLLRRWAPQFGDVDPTALWSLPAWGAALVMVFLVALRATWCRLFPAAQAAEM